MINDPMRPARHCDIKTPEMTAKQGSEGFPPVVAGQPQVLILGSLPGRASLQAGQYYAQARNCFWPIMGDLFGAGRHLSYADRTRRLTAHAVALWDVIASAHRPGSLDSRIDRSTMILNDLGGFLAEHATIRLVCFNGRTAEHLYTRFVLPGLDVCAQNIERRVLPSTSPAYAALSYADKLARWSEALA
jgi:hypoxanthine-DNA glycosylase